MSNKRLKKKPKVKILPPEQRPSSVVYKMNSLIKHLHKVAKDSGTTLIAEKTLFSTMYHFEEQDKIVDLDLKNP